MLIGQVCLDSSSKGKAVTGTDTAMCLGIILGNGVWEIDCKNGCNSLPLPIAVPFAMFLLSKAGVCFPTLKSGLDFWIALTNWMRWKWVYVSFRPRSWEAWALMLYLLRQCYMHKWKDVRSKQGWSIPVESILDHSVPSWPTTWLCHMHEQAQPRSTQLDSGHKYHTANL